MLLVKTELVKEYLDFIGRNQTWLAEKMKLHKSTISQYVNNEDKPSTYFVSQLMTITNMRFEDLFIFDGKPDTRSRYGDVHVIDGETMRLPKYKKHISAIKREHAEQEIA